MKYADKLKDPRWQRKRLEIFERDNFTCLRCDDKNSPLVIHHIIYFPNTEPWDIPDFLLETLCEHCHEEDREYPISSKLFILIHTILQYQKKTLESELEQNYNKDQSIRLDCLNHYLGC